MFLGLEQNERTQHIDLVVNVDSLDIRENTLIRSVVTLLPDRLEAMRAMRPTESISSANTTLNKKPFG